MSIFVVLVVCAVIFTLQQIQNKDTIPDEVSSLVEDYMEAYKKGTKEAIEYIYFEDDFKREAYLASSDKLLDYEVESIEKINENLYALTILVKTELTTFYSGDTYDQVYNFVAHIDDKWYFLNGVSNIPEEIRDNLDIDQYTYNDENIVDSNDIIDKININ